MFDQPLHFRHSPHRHGIPPARLLVVSGGRVGVGATTVATSLAVTLAREAQRVVLVDADFSRPEIASRCDVSPEPGISDVLLGSRNIHEVLQRGPSGVQVLAGSRSAEARGQLPTRVRQRLLRQYQSLQPHADWIVIDAGHEPHDLVRRLWSAADQVLLVTSPDAVAVMDTYSLVKTVTAGHDVPSPLALVVNQARDESETADVHRRIDQSCRRFLERSIDLAGFLPGEPGEVAHQPAAQDGPLAEAIQTLTDNLLQAAQANHPGSRIPA